MVARASSRTYGEMSRGRCQHPPVLHGAMRRGQPVHADMWPHGPALPGAWGPLENTRGEANAAAPREKRLGPKRSGKATSSRAGAASCGPTLSTATSCSPLPAQDRDGIAEAVLVSGSRGRSTLAAGPRSIPARGEEAENQECHQNPDGCNTSKKRQCVLRCFSFKIVPTRLQMLGDNPAFDTQPRVSLFLPCTRLCFAGVGGGGGLELDRFEQLGQGTSSSKIKS
ncbi:hypothetical protein Anapl_05134 [Anas platyrhynchos]|uniref:Uncharacterized protein n=1 Tax=Anas platyrhynchos TaxID=8839 RepID=R0L019_ANAPL|nr:hypothetical protein Anapl_05134 [Anas platyrhynchos]